jgi:metal-responsive CopG/Arc/MetJ family transcriptional regulator
MPRAKFQPVHIRLHEGLLAEMDALARKLRLDRSALVRMGMARLIEEEAARNPLRELRSDAANSEEPQPEG